MTGQLRILFQFTILEANNGIRSGLSALAALTLLFTRTYLRRGRAKGKASGNAVPSARGLAYGTAFAGAFAASLILFSLPICAQGFTVDDFQASTFSDPTGNTLPYRLFIPKKYDAAKQYPLVLFLHGAGERGNDNRTQLTGQTGELAFLNQAPTDTFMLAPQCPTNDQWVEVPFGQGAYSITNTPLSPSLRTVLSLQNHLLSQYSIDPLRLYVTGLSMGGYGAWDLAMRYPSLYAAVIPLSGAGDPSRGSLMVGTPVWAFHGRLDETVPSEGDRKTIEAILAAGGTPRYTEYSMSYHDIWNFAYSTPDLVPWTFSQKRTLITETIAPEPGALCFAAALLFGVSILGIRRRARTARLTCC